MFSLGLDGFGYCLCILLGLVFLLFGVVMLGCLRWFAFG